MTTIDKLNGIVLDDIELYKDNKYIPRMLEVISSLIRTTETPDYHIPDLNAMVGYYLDEAEFFVEDYEYTKKEFFECYDKYIQYAFILNEMVVVQNLEKLKQYDSDDAIFVK